MVTVTVSESGVLCWFTWVGVISAEATAVGHGGKQGPPKALTKTDSSPWARQHHPPRIPAAASSAAAAAAHTLPHHRYMECSLYLARLLLGCGQGEAARDILQQLDADIEQHQLTLPDTQGQQLLLLLSKASLHLQLGQREAFAASLLPQFTGLLDQAENNAAVVAAAKKVRVCGGGQPEGPVGRSRGMLQGAT